MRPIPDRLLLALLVAIGCKSKAPATTEVTQDAVAIPTSADAGAPSLDAHDPEEDEHAGGTGAGIGARPSARTFATREEAIEAARGPAIVGIEYPDGRGSDRTALDEARELIRRLDELTSPDAD